GGLLGYKIFVFLLKASGLRAAYALLIFVVPYFIIFAPSATSSIYRYFRDILAFSRLKAIASVYKNFFIFGQTLIDKVAIMAGIKNKFTYTFEGENNLLQLNELNQGGILIS